MSVILANRKISELMASAESLSRAMSHAGWPNCLTVTVRDQDWHELLEYVKNLTSMDKISISLEDMTTNKMRFQFRGVLYEGMTYQDAVRGQVADIIV